MTTDENEEGNDATASPHDPERVEGLVRRAEVVTDSLQILSEYQHHSFEDYRRNRELRDVVERRLEKVTQAAIDIANGILADRDCSVPKANQDKFRRLGLEGVLPVEGVDREKAERETASNVGGLAEEMADAAGLRNVLAHEYGDVLDDRMVYHALQNLERYSLFLEEIETYLDEVGAFEEADAFLEADEE